MTRIVLRGPNWLGDAVLAIPAMAALRGHYADAHLTVAGSPSVVSLFREITPIRPDEILELPTAHGAAIRTLQAGRFDVCVLLPNSFRSAWQARRASIAERWGYATSGRGW